MSDKRPAEAMLTVEVVLAFERGWWKYADNKRDALRYHFDVDEKTYAARLEEVIDDPAAESIDKTLVRRHKRMREVRRRRAVIEIMEGIVNRA